LEPQRQLLGAQSRVDHQAQPAALDDRRISSAPAAQHCKSHHARTMRVPGNVSKEDLASAGADEVFRE
jgi:hypothetical protein